MTLTLILLVVILLAVGIIIFLAKSRKKYKKNYATEKKKKEVLKKSVDNVLVYGSESRKIASQTAEHVEILRKTKDKKDVEKELTILRDNIFADYSEHKQLRND